MKKIVKFEFSIYGQRQQLQRDDATLPHYPCRCCCMGERAIFPCFC